MQPSAPLRCSSNPGRDSRKSSPGKFTQTTSDSSERQSDGKVKGEGNPPTTQPRRNANALRGCRVVRFPGRGSVQHLSESQRLDRSVPEFGSESFSGWLRDHGFFFVHSSANFVRPAWLGLSFFNFAKNFFTSATSIFLSFEIFLTAARSSSLIFRPSVSK